MIKATFVTAALLVAVSASTALALEEVCAPVQPCGDVNDSGSVTASDSLAVLKKSVGQPAEMICQCQVEICAEGALLNSGQITCYDPLDLTNPVDTIECFNSGQDGEFQRGLVFDYVDNGDGTITDQKTGLIWEKLADDGGIHDFQDFAYQWAGAYGKINNLNAMNAGSGFANHNDWRLPNVRELASLVNYSASNPSISSAFETDCGAGCSVTECSCTHTKPYWSSTTAAASLNSAWSVNFATGAVASTAKTVYNYVRAVRAGK